jgi:hypothetical protein
MRAAKLTLPIVFVLLAACARESQDAATASAPAKPSASLGERVAAPAPVNAPTKPSVSLGERVTAPLVALSTIAQDPARYRGQVVATSGTVTAVCREMGCWMEIGDASSQAHVRIHGHSFFVPKTSPGHLARVQAVVLPAGSPQSGADLDCEETKTAAPPKLTKVELEATGVEID